MNLAQILSEKAQTFGPKPAVQFKNQWTSFADLDQRFVKKAAKVLINLNICKGERVALLLPKGLTFIKFTWRLWGRGPLPCP